MALTPCICPMQQVGECLYLYAREAFHKIDKKKEMITTEERQENQHNARVIIVGGGITGLSLAAVLAER